MSLLLTILTICAVFAEESAKLVSSSSSESHNPQKRSASLIPQEAQDDLILSDDQLAYPLEDGVDKRGSLLRFGKRGSLFRFGKRGSLFRFGKRGSLFRFGKRGSLFRFGRSGNSDLDNDLEEQKRGSLFRFGKRSDEDVLRAALYQSYPGYAEDVSKRQLDGFHWGQAGDDQ